MPGSIERPTLWVEGDDDFHTIVHLLNRHGIDYDAKPWSPQFPVVKKAGNVEQLLKGIATEVSVSVERAVGFVLDADSPVSDRWRSVRDRLVKVDVPVPELPPISGFIGQSTKFKSQVGVWLMPDNRRDGTLEHFLHDLIDERDSLIAHSTSATEAAQALGAKFPEVHKLKAVLHAWLAWQKAPGKPYGTAIQAKYFRDDSDAARAFLAWFRQLYGIAAASAG